METLAILIPLLVAIAMGVPGIIALVAQRKKTKAEAEKIKAEKEKTEEEREKIRAETTEIIRRMTAEQLKSQEEYFDEKEKDYVARIDALEETVNELRIELDTVKECLAQTIEGAHLLYAQVLKHEEPLYTPPPMIAKRKKK